MLAPLERSDDTESKQQQKETKRSPNQPDDTPWVDRIHLKHRTPLYFSCTNIPLIISILHDDNIFNKSDETRFLSAGCLLNIPSIHEYYNFTKATLQ